jgi:large subunit ribosomal protein L17
MRHKVAGKKLSRNMEERIALQRGLALALIERFGEDKEFIITTITKAKWVRPFIEKCITLGIKGHRELAKAADANGTTIEELKRQQREEKKKFKEFSPQVREHLTKSIHMRRMASQRLGCTQIEFKGSSYEKTRSDKALKTLFDDIAPRYLERAGGYLRVLRTSERRLGDKGQKALLGFVEGTGEHAKKKPSADGEESGEE